MADSSLLDTSTVNLSDIFSNGKIYRVPPYQRDYSWEEENWEDLWNDIVELESLPWQHYMGAIVLQTSSDGLTVIDGQQRLATLSILTLAVLKKLLDLGQQGVEPGENQERYDLLYKQYIGTKDPASLRYSSKLFLNKNDDGFYQQYLIQFRSPLNPRKLRGSEERMWSAYCYFSEKLGTHFHQRLNGSSLADFLNGLIARKLTFIQIRVQDDLSAYTVFETLNARGLELTSTDLLKNYLFSKVAQSNIDLTHVQAQWNKVSSIVGMDEFPDFLRHFLNSRQKVVRRERLFKTVKLQVVSRDDVFSLLDSLETAAYWYRALEEPHDEHWQDYPGCSDLVRVLRLFGVSQYKPLILACRDRLKASDFKRVLRACLVVSFRFNVIGRRNPNLLEDVYNGIAIDVHQGRCTEVGQIVTGLSPAYVHDDEFKSEFSSATIPTEGRKKKIVSYILCELERHRSGADLDFETLTGTVEHILPENPSEEWSAFSEEDRERFTYRLGNYSLLEKKLNKEAANLAFSVKIPIYRKSQYQITRDIDSDDWTPNAVVIRQKMMSQWASTIWRLD